MIIHPITSTFENGELCLAARVELESPNVPVPDTVWFKFPEAEAEWVNPRADGFAIALLNLALRLGEDIHVRGTLSPRVVYGMQEFQAIQSLWHARELKKIKICADTYAPSQAEGNQVAAAFSGGVDSFFTMWSHLKDKELYPDDGITCGLFIHGFDIGLHDAQTFETCRAAYAAQLGQWGVQLLTASTNVRQFDPAGDWVRAGDVGLIGTAHLLGRQVRRFYVPSSDSYGDFPAWRADSLMDALLSSEALEILTDGGPKHRFEKIQVLATVPETYALLRVCYTIPNGLENCCRCDNCVTTMTALELCGALHEYTTFPLPLTRRRIAFMRVPHAMLAIHLGTLRGALRARRYPIALGIGLKLALNSFRWGLHWVERGMQHVVNAFERKAPTL